MRVLLLSVNTEVINMPTLPLGLACVAASARHSGHEVGMVDLRPGDDVRRVLQKAARGVRPEVIGISVRNIDNQDRNSPKLLLDPVREIVALSRKTCAAKVVLGGAGYSLFPEKALSYLGADMGIQGEGEISFPLLLDRLSQGGDPAGVPGLFLPGKGLQGTRLFCRSLDCLSLPEPDLWPLPEKMDDLWMPVQSRRGCPLRCSYCSTETIEGRLLRRRSPEIFVESIARWRRAGVDKFFFVDNTFNIPPEYAKEICRRLIERDLKIKWWSILYPSAADPDLIALMARSGCEQVSVGFESGSERMLKRMNKRFTPEDVRRACRVLEDHGIRRMGFLLLGGPGETRESVEESLFYADSLDLDNLKITVGIRIYPYTALAETAILEGVLAMGDDLLLPRFYLSRDLEDWLPRRVREALSSHRNWTM